MLKICQIIDTKMWGRGSEERSLQQQGKLNI